MNSPTPEPITNVDALIDICVCFGQHCGGRLDTGGRQRFLTLFRDHIEKGLNSARGPSWANSREGVLEWTRTIAEDAELERRGGTVTAKILRDISQRRIPAWTEECFSEREKYGPFCPVPGDAL